MADPTRGALIAAATELGLRVWRAGQDVETALTLAGYSWDIARGVRNYIYSTSEPELEAYSQATSQGTTTTSTEEMSTPNVKRARTVTVRRKQPPVAKNVKAYVRKCVKHTVEKKYLTVIGGTIVPGIAGTIIGAGVETIQQGTSDATRVGNEIDLVSVTVRGTISDSTAAPGPYPAGWIRLVLFYDKQTDGTAPTVTNVLEGASVYQPFNHDYVVGHGGGRFNILQSKLIKYESHAVANAADNTVIPFVMHAKLSGKLVRYKGNAGTVADVASGYIGLLAIGLNATIQTYTIFDTCYQDS